MNVAYNTLPNYSNQFDQSSNFNQDLIISPERFSSTFPLSFSSSSLLQSQFQSPRYKYPSYVDRIDPRRAVGVFRSSSSSIIARPLVIGPVKQRSVTKKESRRHDSRRGVWLRDPALHPLIVLPSFLPSFLRCLERRADPPCTVRRRNLTYISGS